MTTQPIKILMVDDEPDLEPLVKQRLRNLVKEGVCTFDFAHNGVQALEILKNNPDIQFIFTDINMPEMDGLTLLAELQKKEENIKAVVISAYGDMTNIRTAMNEGAFDFLVKPIDFEDLKSTIGKGIKEIKIIQEAKTLRVDLKNEKEEKDQALNKAQLKQDFLANMSHEIRTPMNAIIGMTDLLGKGHLDEVQKKYINTIKLSAKNLLVILNDVLDISKIEAGKLNIELIPFNIKEQITLLYDTLSPKAEEKGIDLVVQMGDNIPESVIGDPTRLSQILINLVGNAIKFTEEGKVMIDVQILQTDEEHIQLQVSVKDQGIGIPSDKIDSIFESFSQAENSTTRKYGGTGLGLTITKRLLELQNGLIKVSSEHGEGSTFYFEIPYLIDRKGASNQNEQRDLSRLKGLKILLAEDNEFNQMVAEDTLRSMIDGVEIHIVENGMAAIDALNKNIYDLVLMDIHMPEMDGIEATKQIRANNIQVPIIAMTASVIQEDVERFKAAGMDAFIPKPFVENDILHAFFKVLK